MPALYPLFLNLNNRPVLIVGGGSVALRKAQGLLDAGAKLTIIAPRFSPEVSKLKRITRIKRPYRPSDMKLQDWTLVFAATDSPAANAAVQKHAKQRVLCCRCDNPDQSDFSGAATAHVGPIIVAIGTTQASPALAARIRDQAAAAVDPVLATLAEILPPWRAKTKKLLTHPLLRRNLLQQLSGPEMEETLRRLGPRHARQLFERWLAEARKAAGRASTPSSGARTR